MVTGEKDYQEKLVSWTNIKTINNNSILLSWNIDIQWWWWGWQIIFDAIVDYSGNGDYTTLWDALQAWMTSIYIKNGTYTESQVEIVDNNFLVIWETEWGVILNYETTQAKPYCIKFTASTKTTLADSLYNIIKNVTINIDMQWWNYAYNGTSVIKVGIPSVPIFATIYFKLVKLFAGGIILIFIFPL